MNKTIISAIAVGTMVLAACGSDDDGASGVQSEAAQATIDLFSELGLDLDESCVKDVAKKLSDEDAQAIVDAGTGDDAELSDDGEALTAELLACIGDDALTDSTEG